MTANTEIAGRLRAIVAKELKRDVSSITPEHRLREDLKLNSLDAIELMFRIEEEFDLSIPDDDMQGLIKVGDLIDYLERRLSGEPAPAALKPVVAAPPAAAAPRPAVAPPRVTPAPQVAVAPTRATPPSKVAAKKAKPKAARRRA